MATNMAVSVTLQLRDQFTGPVRQLINNLQQLTRVAQDFNRALGGTGGTSPFGRIQTDVRRLNADVRQLAGSFQSLARSMGTPGGSFAQRQIGDMRTLLGLQQQAIANNTRLNSGGGSGRVPNVPGTGGIFGSRGFHPNASLIDRAQYRAVNLGEQSLATGFLDLDRARTRLAMLATPREGQRPILSQEDLGLAETAATQYSQIFRSLSRAHVLDTFGEVATQFQNIDHAFRLLPELLNVQDWHVLMGDSVEQARAGMLSLVRAIGLSGRLIDNEGRLSLVDPKNPNSPIQASEFLDAYMRARIVGGRDVTPDQVFQVMKYLKTTGQTLDMDSLLTTFIAMPDIRASTFGNQLNMLIRGLTGGATQAAQQAAERAGLGRITERTGSGPHGFQVSDEVMLRENPFAWFGRHIMGPGGVLARAGLNVRDASMAQIATIMRPIFSNQSAFNSAMSIIGQWREWSDQSAIARRANLTPEARQQHAAGSSWHQLNTARSALQDAMGSVAENFKGLLNPALESASAGLKQLARLIDPRTGESVLSTGVLVGGSIAALMLGRRMLMSMSPTMRMLLGGGAGYLIGGDPMSILTGAMLGRGIGVGSSALGIGAGTAGAAGAAGVAGAAAGAAWGGRFMGAARWVARAIGSLLRGSIIWGGIGYAVGQIVDNWESFKTRMLAIYDELKRAAPTWLGGEGEGWGAFAGGQGVAKLPEVAQSYGQDWGEWLRNLPPYAWMYEQGWLRRPLTAAERSPTGGLDLADQAAVPRNTVTMDITNNITVHVTTPASPSAIGEAAAGAIGSQLRGLMADPLPAGAP
jgi:methyl-accepting chemotaxis protein